MKEKRERTQITNIKNERETSLPFHTEIKKIIKEYYEQVYAHKFENLDKMD